MRLRILLVTLFFATVTGLWFWTAPLDTGDTGAAGFNSRQENAVHNIGDSVDSYNGVTVYYNGDIDHVYERNLASNGYNIGLKYQCVEFVKRFYLEHYKHEMPHTYGDAKDFFNKKLAEGVLNKERNLFQFPNGAHTPPRVGDILVFDGIYGHVVILTEIRDTLISFIQQNPGPDAPSRESLPLYKSDGLYTIGEGSALGWLGLR